jgi:hypothetical protein
VGGFQPISEEKPGQAEAWRATGLERPVFLDETGRRGRLVRVAGGAAALVVAAWLGLVIAGPFGFARLPTAALPALGRHLHAVNLVHRPHRASLEHAVRAVPVKATPTTADERRS